METTCGVTYGICKYTQKSADNSAFYQTISAYSSPSKVVSRGFYRASPSGDVSFRKRMDGSKHLGAVDVKMVFSYVHGDFGIRIVCCFSFGEYCLSKSRTLL